MARAVNQAGTALAKQAEGLRLETYRCPAGKPTIGYGHTGRDVKDGMTITEARADELLAGDLARAGDAILAKVEVPLNDNQYAALCDFVFNLGAGAFQRSTLLKKLNLGDYAGAAREFARWDKARVDGELKTLAGLTKRRTDEQALFLTPAG